MWIAVLSMRDGSTSTKKLRKAGGGTIGMTTMAIAIAATIDHPSARQVRRSHKPIAASMIGYTFNQMPSASTSAASSVAVGARLTNATALARTNALTWPKIAFM